MMSLSRILCREYLPQMIWPVLGMAGLALRFIWPAADLLGSMVFFLCCVAAGLSAGRQAERRTEPARRHRVPAVGLGRGLRGSGTASAARAAALRSRPRFRFLLQPDLR